ncbi:hypothetical protein [Sphingomonas carotinifaciens]|uniref:Uncharacterized protein n=1 Tax=Sphingomonas carotinifaciens TaxID=1166323 RepID=A0A1G7MF45_9SPHN|nr:hypothetical protein [Sphingomonas carotinifaciens]MBB4086848.1 hypothetical protein [Sphingomonas carotinifaciens]SDF60347.1 hypothetical protein SAMN05216557_104167 [Sphingomonas carotinifaciens]
MLEAVRAAWRRIAPDVPFSAATVDQRLVSFYQADEQAKWLFAMRTWLAGFDDRITLSPLYFVGVSLLAIGVAVLTVLGQSLCASRAAPAWALRHD